MQTTEYRLSVSKRKGAWKTQYVFVDLPGERFADADFLTCNDIFEWSKNIVHHFKISEDTRALSKPFRDYFDSLSKDSSDGDAKIGKLEKEYRKLLFSLVATKHSLITPSSALLDSHGNYVPEDVQDDEKKLKDWFINQSQLGLENHPAFPIPDVFSSTNTGRNMQKAFKKYRNTVVRPTLGKFKNCQDVIILCDIAAILEMGPSWLNTYEKLLREIATILDPSYWHSRRLKDAGRLFGKLLLQDHFRYTDRIFFLASQCDRVHESNLNNLQRLAHDIAVTAFTNLETENKITCLQNFEIAAVDSTVTEGDWVKYENHNGDNEHKQFKKIPSQLPSRFPDSWKPHEYNFPRPIAHFPARRLEAPRSRNMDRISKLLLHINNK